MVLDTIVKIFKDQTSVCYKLKSRDTIVENCNYKTLKCNFLFWISYFELFQLLKSDTILFPKKWVVGTL